jgi:hypothetical protein
MQIANEFWSMEKGEPFLVVKTQICTQNAIDKRRFGKQFQCLVNDIWPDEVLSMNNMIEPCRQDRCSIGTKRLSHD